MHVYVLLTLSECTCTMYVDSQRALYITLKEVGSYLELERGHWGLVSLHNTLSDVHI